MRVAVIGSGGVGGYFGGRLARAGVPVSFIARGAHLEAIRRNGLRVESVAGDFLVDPADATNDPREIGRVDYVLIAVKTWQLPAALDLLDPLVGDETAVVSLLNGVEAPSQIAAAIGRAHVLPGTVKIFSAVAEPGVVRHIGGPASIAFAEWDDRSTPRVQALRDMLRLPGVAVDVPEDIQRALWEKFLFVVPMGSIGAVSRSPIGVTRSIPATRELLQRGMREIHTLGLARGIRLSASIVEESMSFLDAQPPTGTSSLQRDLEAGRRSELDAWTGAVVRLAAEEGLDVPVHDFVYRAVLPHELRARGELAFPE